MGEGSASSPSSSDGGFTFLREGVGHNCAPEDSGTGLPPPSGVSEPYSCPPAHPFMHPTVHSLIPPASLSFRHPSFYPLTSGLCSHLSTHPPTLLPSSSHTATHPAVHTSIHSFIHFPLYLSFCPSVPPPTHQSIYLRSLLGCPGLDRLSPG